MFRLHERLREVHHLIKGGPRQTPSYQLSQVSVEYLVTALNSHAEPPDSPETVLQTGVFSCLFYGSCIVRNVLLYLGIESNSIDVKALVL